jgi:putative hydrolase of the HAD superfamily
MMNDTQEEADSGVLIECVRQLSQPLLPQPTGYATRMTALTDIRAVIFDIYGTLLVSGTGDVGPASGEENELALRAALSAAGLPVEQIDRNTRSGRILIEAIRRAQAVRREQGIEFPEVDIIAVWRQVLVELGKHGLRTQADAAQVRRLAIEYECRVNPVWPMPGLRTMLASLRATGRHLGIVSNAQFYTPLMFRALLDAGPGDLGFDPRLCAWSWKALQGKPSRGLFQQVLTALAMRYDVAPEQTLYVGNDMLKDIWPAAGLGCKTALFAGDRRSLRLRQDDERCQGLQPDLVIDHLSQLGSL